MHRWIFAVMIALCAVACEKKVETQTEADGKAQDISTQTSGELYHVTCFSGGQVIYEGDLKYFRGDYWGYIDMKTKMKFIFKDQNDCYWTSAPFYKVKD